MLANHFVRKCYYCGKKGHIQNECFKKQVDDAKRKQESAKYRGYFVEEEDKDFSHEFQHLMRTIFGMSIPEHPIT